MTRKCRLWWPTVLSTTEPKSSVLLFGWFVSSSSMFLDIIVAFGCDEVSFAPHQSRLQGLLHETSESMSMSLQDKCSFSLLGHCAVSRSSKGRLMPVGVNEDDQNHEISSTHTNGCTDSCQNRLGEKYEQPRCGCCKLGEILDHAALDSVGDNNLIQLVYGANGYVGRKIKWIPELHHMHWNGQIVPHFDLHVILYETPIFGSHHFSVRIQRSEQVKAPLKKPKWVEELHQKQSLLDLDTAVMAINSSYAATLCFEKLVCYLVTETMGRVRCFILHFILPHFSVSPCPPEFCITIMDVSHIGKGIHEYMEKYPNPPLPNTLLANRSQR